MGKKVIFRAEDYHTQFNLENDINEKVGSDEVKNKKSKHVIKGSESKLFDLAIQNSDYIFGCKIEVRK